MPDYQSADAVAVEQDPEPGTETEKLTIVTVTFAAPPAGSAD